MIPLIMSLMYSSVTYYFTGKFNYTKLKAGNYTIECYGAQGGGSYTGGSYNLARGGKGAFVSGTIKITGDPKMFYIYVGGQGVPNKDDHGKKGGPNEGGFNGGGSSGEDKDGNGDDASGGGGGATDIRYLTALKSSRVMVAAGGSGAAYTTFGAPGGDLKGRRYKCYDSKLICEDYKIIESPLTNQTGGGNNGFGGFGIGSIFTPGSGGGGGYYGGVSSGIDARKNFYKAVADSGSSYISGYKGCQKYQDISFTNSKMIVGNHSGHGKLVIKTNYECSDNCSDCTSSSMCTKCLNNTKLYNNKCVVTCPDGTRVNGDRCQNCSAGCSSCPDKLNTCTSCMKNFFLYGSTCYKTCDTFSKPSQNIYYGKNLKENKCQVCSIENCIDCSSDYSKCNQCASSYYFDANLNKCILKPTMAFTVSHVFTISDVFSNSAHFTDSSFFSSSANFDIESDSTKNDELSLNSEQPSELPTNPIISGTESIDLIPSSLEHSNEIDDQSSSPIKETIEDYSSDITKISYEIETSYTSTISIEQSTESQSLDSSPFSLEQSINDGTIETKIIELTPSPIEQSETITLDSLLTTEQSSDSEDTTSHFIEQSTDNEDSTSSFAEQSSDNEDTTSSFAEQPTDNEDTASSIEQSTDNEDSTSSFVEQSSDNEDTTSSFAEQPTDNEDTASSIEQSTDNEDSTSSFAEQSSDNEDSTSSFVEQSSDSEDTTSPFIEQSTDNEDSTSSFAEQSTDNEDTESFIEQSADNENSTSSFVEQSSDSEDTTSPFIEQSTDNEDSTSSFAEQSTDNEDTESSIEQSTDKKDSTINYEQSTNVFSEFSKNTVNTETFIEDQTAISKQEKQIKSSIENSIDYIDSKISFDEKQLSSFSDETEKFYSKSNHVSFHDTQVDVGNISFRKTSKMSMTIIGVIIAVILLFIIIIIIIIIIFRRKVKESEDENETSVNLPTEGTQYQSESFVNPLYENNISDPFDVSMEEHDFSVIYV